MIDVTAAMNSRKDRGNLLLLSKFLRPEELKDLPAYWKEPLGESPFAVANRFHDEELIEPAPPEVKLDLKCKVTDLKALLKGKGLKQSGRKAELIVGLMENDPDAIRKKVGRWRIFQCSQAGRSLALEFESASSDERRRAESEVLGFLMQSDYRSASIRMADFESKQVFWRGVNVDWANHDPEPDVDTLDFMFAGWPDILKPVPSELRDALRLGAAMMELFGETTAMQWFEEVPETGSHLDPDTVMRMLCFSGRHLREMREFKRMGVRTVEILGGDDEESCPHCVAIGGRRFPIDKVPELPLATCTSSCGCRCLALSGDFGP